MDRTLKEQLITKKNLTKDDLVKMFIDMQERTTSYMKELSGAVYKLNDSNRLHKQAIDINTMATREMSSNVKGLLSMFRWILIALVITVISIALGKQAEQILRYLPFIK